MIVFIQKTKKHSSSRPHLHKYLLRDTILFLLFRLRKDSHLSSNGHMVILWRQMSFLCPELLFTPDKLCLQSNGVSTSHCQRNPSISRKSRHYLSGAPSHNFGFSVTLSTNFMQIYNTPQKVSIFLEINATQMDQNFQCLVKIFFQNCKSA